MIQVQTDRFDPGQLQAELTGNSAVGAVVTFTGYVRQTDTLELEHYEGMTQSVMADLRAQAMARFELEDALLVHRVGSLATGEPIVWVGCSAAHRSDAFEAAMFLMDHLKSQVPLWKREQGQWLSPNQQDLSKLEAWG